MAEDRVTAPTGPKGAPGEHPPLQGGALALGAIGVALATFMNVLDMSIANVSLPTIAGDLAVSPNQGTWVITSFGVANAISMPLTGWLTQRFGAVRLFVASVLGFVLTSWLCGLAPTLPWLIAFRVLQGLVAGPMIPLSQALLMSSFARDKAEMGLGIWSMTTLVAPVAGPLLGGWITENMTWPWIFYINIPVGLGAAAVVWTIYRHRETPTRRLPIDGVGLALLIVWVGALQIMLDKGEELDWFNSDQIAVLAVVAFVGFIYFVAWELTEAHPIVDLRLFTRRNFAIGTATISIGFGIYFGNIVLLPLWLQQHMSYTATIAGMALAPIGLFAILLSPLVGKNAAKFDPRLLATVAFLVFALTMWLRSRYTPQDDLWTILIPTIVQGAGVAFFFIPLMSLILSGLPPDRIPAATGLSNFARICASSFGTSIATTVWDDRATLHHTHLVEQLGASADTGPLGEAWSRLAAQGLSSEQIAGLINSNVNQQVFTRSVDDVFLASAFLFVVMIALVWFAKPMKGSTGAHGGGAH